MTEPKYTPEDMAAVSDNPELTDAQIASLRPFAEVFPELAARAKDSSPEPAPSQPRNA